MMNKAFVKKIVFSNNFFYTLYTFFSSLLKFFSSLLKKKGRIKIDNKGVGFIRKIIHGDNNFLQVGKYSVLKKTEILVKGCNNSIVIGKNCFIGENCSFWIEGSNSTILIGDKCTFTHTVHLCVQEDNMKIEIGEDCMLSNNIIIRTSDSHPIYDNIGNRINNPQPVKLGNHVWVAPNSKIFKGVCIGSGSIIGSNSVVTKCISDNCLAVGMPSVVKKENVKWTRERLY